MVLLNIFLLYTNIQRQNRITILTGRLIACEQKNVHLTNKDANLTLPKDFINNKNPISLITIFTDRGCSPCVADEISFLNNLNRKYHPFINVYQIGGFEHYLNRYGAVFEYRNNEHLSELSSLIVDNPISLIIDRNNTLLLIHKAETGNPEKSRIFFERVESLFESVYGH